MKTILLVIVCAVGVALSTNAIAQKENNVWHFGDKAGLDFNVDPPQPIRSPYEAIIEGVATISDPETGQLLISTDGTTVWNRDLQVMPNGTGLIGGAGTSAQGVLILPFPRNKDLYYLFTCDQAGYVSPNQGVKYSVVDMRLDNGKGAVTEKNVDVFGPPMYEQLTAVPHSNGCDYWVLAMDTNRNFLAVRVGDSIEGPPVVSSPGPNDVDPYIGYLVSNPAGTMLAYSAHAASACIFDFDKSTGVVSNARTIYTNGAYLYGACFSPDGTKLYIGSASPTLMMQFDVSLPTTAAIRASGQEIYTGAPFTSFGAIRPGPDGKLYVGMWNNFLGVVNNPNAAGAACDFDPQGLRLLSGTQSRLGLPNTLDSWVGRSMRPCYAPIEPLSIDVTFGAVCAGDCIEFASVGAGNRRVVWQVSDGRKLEDVASPSICFDSAGTYTVELLAIGDGGDTARSLIIPVTVKPALNFSLRSYSFVTDTVGALIKVPIVLNDTISSLFEGEFSFDPDRLEYAGSFDKEGNPIDAGSFIEEGQIRITKQIDRDSIVGYMFFNLYWADTLCRLVTLESSSLTSVGQQCLSNDVLYDLCLGDGCGTQLLSRHLRSIRLLSSISPNPASSTIEIRTSHDLSDATLTLTDMNGREVLRLVASFRAEQPLVVDVSKLTEGVYFLTIQSRLGVDRKTVVIKR